MFADSVWGRSSDLSKCAFQGSRAAMAENLQHPGLQERLAGPWADSQKIGGMSLAHPQNRAILHTAFLKLKGSLGKVSSPQRRFTGCVRRVKGSELTRQGTLGKGNSGVLITSVIASTAGKAAREKGKGRPRT